MPFQHWIPVLGATLLLYCSPAFPEGGSIDAPGFQPPDTSRQEISPEQAWTRNTCFVTVPDLLRKKQAACFKYGEEFRCKGQVSCEWRAGKQECWSAEYAMCPRTIQSLCSEVRVVSSFPARSAADRRYICDPSQAGRILRLESQ